MSVTSLKTQGKQKVWKIRIKNKFGIWVNKRKCNKLGRCFDNYHITFFIQLHLDLFWISWFVCLKHQKEFYLWKFSSVSSRCKRISSAHSREGAPVIFSFTLWNNCLNIACSIASSSPEKWAILCQNQRPRRLPRVQANAAPCARAFPPSSRRTAPFPGRPRPALRGGPSAAGVSFRKATYLALGKQESLTSHLWHSSLFYQQNSSCPD